MLRKIKKLNFRKVTQSTLAKNYFFLSTYQVVNFAVPLIIVPFIISRVGVTNFGLIAFSYAFVNYFNVIVDYGFTVSATRKISVNKENSNVINNIFTTVFAIKLILLVLSFFMCMLLVFSVPLLRQQWQLHLLSFTLVAGQALIPIWLFQGMEDMKYLAICNIVSKLSYLVLILIYIQIPEDFYLVNFLQGLSSIGAAILSLYFSARRFHIRLVSFSSSDVRHEFKEGKVLFYSAIAVNIYVNSNAFILGFFAQPAEVGLYSIAEKVFLALKQFDNVFSQVIFPRICMLAVTSVSALKKFLTQIFKPFLVFIVAACFVVFFAGHFISAYFLHGAIDPYLITLINIFCLTVIVNAFNTPTFQTLLAYNEKKRYGIVLMSGCIVNIVSNLVLAHFFKALGTACSILITELFITAGLGYFFFKVIKQKQHEIEIGI